MDTTKTNAEPIGVVAVYNKGGSGEFRIIEPVDQPQHNLASVLPEGAFVYASAPPAEQTAIEWEQRAKHAEAALEDLQARVNAKYDEVVANRLPAHLREFVEAVEENYTYYDQMEDLHCSGCSSDLSNDEPHAPDCIVLRARALLLAANKEKA